VEAGRAPGPGNGRPARLDRGEDRRRRLRQAQLAQERRLATAALELSEVDSHEQPLDRDQTAVLLRLLDLALSARVASSRPVPLVAAGYRIRLTLTPVPGRFTTVRTAGGLLHLDGFALTVAPVHARELVPA
jgi:hypothetical protein